MYKILNKSLSRIIDYLFQVDGFPKHALVATIY